MARSSLLVRCGAALLAAATFAQTPASAPTTRRPWVFLIYAAIDNNAEADGNFFAFLRGVRAAYADDSGIEIVVFADRSSKYSTDATAFGEDFSDARLYRVQAATCERLDGGAEFPEVTRTSSFEPDSADPIWLHKFLAWARARHPAQRTALLFYGHADGTTLCPDEDSGREMGIAQITDVVPAELSVDLIACELCNMSGVEIAYQWRRGSGGFGADWLVAIPNAGPPLDWGRAFARLRAGSKAADAVDPATMTPQRFGELIVEEGGNGRRAMAAEGPDRARRVAHEAVACCDLRQATAVKQAVDALAAELGRSDSRAAVQAAYGPRPDGIVLNYVRDRLRERPLVDLYDLASRIAEQGELPAATRRAAQAVATATDAFVVASWGGTGLQRFRPGKCGVFIVLPTGDADVAADGKQVHRSWSRCRWYSPRRVPDVYGSFAWCRDGCTPGDGVVQNWFELLDCWFDERNAEGGSNAVAY